MKDSLRTGVTFGLTSGIITTLGVIVGLHSGTHSLIVVVGGIVTIAVADAFSDALGIHISEESENVHTSRQIWVATIATFATKFLFALTFLIPIFVFPLPIAIIVSLIWGMSVLGVVSYVMARAQEQSPAKVVCEHLSIAGAVVVVTHLLGDWMSSMTG